MTTIKKSTTIKNSKIYLDKLVNLNFINIVYELNKDFFESCQKREESSPHQLYIINKWLFKDAGLPQTACFLNMEEIDVDENCKIIKGTCSVGESSYMLLSGYISLFFDMTDKHNVIVNIEVFTEMEMNDFYERMCYHILTKIINNVKQFIEKMIL